MAAQTLTIEIKDSIALKLLKEMEFQKLISILRKPDSSKKKEKTADDAEMDESEIAAMLDRIYKDNPQEPMTKEEFVASILEAEAQIDRGEFITIEDLEKEMKEWD
jgi:hypothetical protein